MCGITGIYSAGAPLAADRSLVISMANEISHRGPDELSCLIEDQLALGFRRLSIIDVRNGHQPFFNADGSVILICNGEIYNHRELWIDLVKKVYKFRTQC